MKAARDSRERTVHAVGPSKTELQDGQPAGGVDHPGGLGGHQGLEVDTVQHQAFHELDLHECAVDPQQGLAGKDRRSLGGRRTHHP